MPGCRSLYGHLIWWLLLLLGPFLLLLFILPVQGCGHSLPVTSETIMKTSHKDFQMLIGGF